MNWTAVDSSAVTPRIKSASLNQLVRMPETLRVAAGTYIHSLVAPEGESTQREGAEGPDAFVRNNQVLRYRYSGSCHHAPGAGDHVET